MLTRKEDAKVKDLETHLVRIYAERDDCTIALIEVKGRHPWVRNGRSDMLYYVVQGNGTFYLDDEALEVTEGDFLTVSKETPYHMEGRFKALNISVPFYDPASDIILD